jgi:hypothetical protein
VPLTNKSSWSQADPSRILVYGCRRSLNFPSSFLSDSAPGPAGVRPPASTVISGAPSGESADITFFFYHDFPPRPTVSGSGPGRDRDRQRAAAIGPGPTVRAGRGPNCDEPPSKLKGSGSESAGGVRVRGRPPSPRGQSRRTPVMVAAGPRGTGRGTTIDQNHGPPSRSNCRPGPPRPRARADSARDSGPRACQ